MFSLCHLPFTLHKNFINKEIIEVVMFISIILKGALQAEVILEK